MANEYVNKVIYGGNTLIDLTGDTVTAAGGTDGTYIIKVFGQASANDLWSA